jgi:hypothetical protein
MGTKAFSLGLCMALGIIAEELRPFLITMKTIDGSPPILIKAEAAVPPPASLIAK